MDSNIMMIDLYQAVKMTNGNFDFKSKKVIVVPGYTYWAVKNINISDLLVINIDDIHIVRLTFRTTSLGLYLCCDVNNNVVNTSDYLFFDSKKTAKVKTRTLAREIYHKMYNDELMPMHRKMSVIRSKLNTLKVKHRLHNK
jgi:hypothetical protein